MANVILVEDVSDEKKFSTSTIVNGKSVNLTAKLKFNSNKGLISITAQVTDRMITGNELEDLGMLESFKPVIMEAIKLGRELKSNWEQSRKDPNQKEMEFGMGGKAEPSDSDDE